MCNIVREPGFDKQIQELTQGHARMDELDSAIDWALQRNPLAIPFLVNIKGDFYLWVTDEFTSIAIPQVRILFRYEEISNTVYLISIEAAQRVSEPAYDA